MYDINDFPLCGKGSESQINTQSCEVVAQDLEKHEQHIIDTDLLSKFDKEVKFQTL